MKRLCHLAACGRYLLVVSLACGWLTACALTPTDRPDTSGAAGASIDLFQEAERHFDAEAFEAAIEAYKRYLSKAPQGRWVAASLMKIGAAYQHLEQPLDALEYYQRLLSEYPNAPYVVDVYLEMIDLYARTQRFDAVIERLPPGDAASMSPGQKVRHFTLRGDAYLALGHPADAYVQYRAAVGASGDGASLPVGAPSLAARLEESIRQLNLAENQLFLEGETHAGVHALLLYYLGFRQAEADQFDLALETLSIFAGRYADHPYIGNVFTLMEEFSHHQQFTPFTLGCLLPLSGPYAVYGQRALNGIELALAQWTTHNWHPFRLVVHDSKGDPEAALAGLTALAEEGVGAVIGPMVTAEAAVPKAQELGLPLIVMTQKAAITATGPYIFRNFMTPEMQMQALGAYAVDTLGLRRFAILYPQEPYGKRFMQQFWRSVAARGGQVTAVESYDPKKTDFAGPIKKLIGVGAEPSKALAAPALIQDPQRQYQQQLNEGGQTLAQQLFATPTAWVMDGYRRSIYKASGPAFSDRPDEALPKARFEAIFLPDAPRKAGLIIPQLAYYDIRHAQLLGTNLWHSEQLLEMARKYVQGAIFTDGFHVDGGGGTAAAAFTTMFKEIYTSDPDLIAATAYDTAEILFSILSEPEIRMRRDIKNRLRQAGPFPGITGQTTFNAHGEAEKALHLLQVQGRKFVELDRLLALPGGALPTDPPSEGEAVPVGGRFPGMIH